MTARPAPTGLQQFVVRLLRSSGEIAGLGVLVGDREIMTCAHVVNKALGRPQKHADTPGYDDLVHIEFPLLSDTSWRGQARVSRWLPPPGKDSAGGDIAGLALAGELPDGASPAKLARSLMPNRLVDVFGYPRGRPGGGFVEAWVRYEVGGGVLQLDSTTGSALRIRPGYSGSPVCDRDSGDVMGLLWMAPRPDSEERDSYAITTGRLRLAWPEVLADVSRDVGQVTGDLFASEWPLLALDVQEHRSLLPRQLVGREWLLAEIETFCREHDRGYFLIEGDAGMGKTAFAAWLARQKRCAAHFAQLDPDAGITKVAVRSLGAQLIGGWNLRELAPGMALPEEAGSYGWFRMVLQAAARSRDETAPGTPIIIVADALDAAAEQPPGHLPMGLPDQLPSGVYAVATTRTGGLRHEPAQEAYARCVLRGARDENMADLRQYIACSAAEDRLTRAIADVRIPLEQFTAMLLERSQGSWIYIKHILEEIRQDPAEAGELPALPRGLKNYYDSSIGSLCEGTDGTSLYLPLLATLAVVAEHVDVPTLAALAGIADHQQVQHAVDRRLLPYCSVTHPPGERRSLFRISHPSLGEYLRGSSDTPSDHANKPRASAQQAVSLRREEMAEACKDAQRRICDRYLNAWGGLDRGLPDLEANPELAGMDGGYALRWLASHLFTAGRDSDLHRLLACGPRGTNIWFAAHDQVGNVAGYLRDVDLARGAARRLGTQLRYALVQASIASLSTTLPPALIGELVTRGRGGEALWDPSRAFRHVERMADEQRQAQVLARIASLLPRELLGPALSVAMRMRKEENRAAALEAVIPHLPGHLLELAAEAVFSVEYGPGYSRSSIEISSDLYLPAMVAVMARLPRELLQKLRRGHVRVFNQVSYARAAYALFWHEDRLRGTRDALAEALELGSKHQRGLLVAALTPHFPWDAFDEVLAVLATTSYLDAPMVALAEHAPAERLGDVLDFAQGRWFPTPLFFRKVTPRLTADHAPGALRLCKAVHREEERAEAFAALAPILDSDQARRFLAPDQSDHFHRPVIVHEVLDLNFELPELVAVSALLDRLPPQEAREVVRERILRHVRRGLPSYPGLPSYESRLPLLGRHLPDDLRQEALGYIYDGLKWPGNAPEKHAALLARFTPLSDHEVAEAFDRAQANSWSDARMAVADVLAPHLTDAVLLDALKRVMAFPLEKECFEALAGLGRFQPPETRGQTAARGLAMTVGIGHVRSKAAAVAALGPILTRSDLAPAAFKILWSIDPLWGVRAMEEMADALPAHLLQAVPGRIRGWIILDPRLDIPKILERLAAEGYTAVIDDLLPDPEGSWDPNGWAEALTALAPHLSESKIRRLWHLWHIGDQEHLVRDGAEALSSLVSLLPADERATAVDEILAAYTPWRDWDTGDARFLGRLARAAWTERLTQTLREMLGSERTARAWVVGELAPGLPGTLIEEALQHVLSDHDDVACRALAKLAPRLSGTLVNRAIARVNEMDSRWKAVALTALAPQLPRDHEDRETVLGAAVEAAVSWPWHSNSEGAVADLIPQLPDRSRARAVNAAMLQVCHQDYRQPGREELDGLRAVLAVLRGPELEELYTQLGNEIRNPQARSRAQAAVIQQAGRGRLARFLPGGKPLHHDWPGDFDRAALMRLIAVAAWWVDQDGDSADVAEVIEAIIDVTRWWP